ncbi:MAG: dTDP-4-dehydrorhamnose reductase [Patescibacteria group bacterium]
MTKGKPRKILVLGANGMLGSQLVKVFAKEKPIAWTKKDLDISNQKQVADKISKLRPEIIINAAGYTAVDDCEKRADKALAVNGKAVGYLAQTCQKINCTLVHFSTDYVFNGNKETGYKENDKTYPVNTYGQSKEYGEKMLKKYLKNYYLIRTSWLFGKNGRNFVDTILEFAPKRVEMKVVNDQFGKPTYALDLATETKEIIEKQPYGIYHVTNEGITSWYNYAKTICRLRHLPTKIAPVTSYEFPRPAKRPRYSILVNTKIKKCRHWRLALKEYLRTN